MTAGKLVDPVGDFAEVRHRKAAHRTRLVMKVADVGGRE
jgi:hypothetical protein